LDSVAPQRHLSSSSATPDTKPRRVRTALVLSLLFPGLGQIYNGQLGKALALWGGWTIAYFCAVAAGLLTTFVGLLVLIFGDFAIYLLICLEAAFYARRHGMDSRRFTPYRWYAYLRFVAIIGALNLAEASLSRRFFFNAYKMSSGSMEPTLLIGEHIIVDKRPRTPSRGDVIVFVFPPDPTKEYVKRVTAVGRDSVEIRNGVTYLNGQQVLDPHAHFAVAAQDRSPASPRDNFGPIRVPAGKLFVMGDSRDHSYDSRFWGFVDNTKVEGRVVFIYWSWDLESDAATRVRWQRIGMPVQ
jgi:signal peptidase I